MTAQDWLTQWGRIGFGGRTPPRVGHIELACDQIYTLRDRQGWIRVTSGSAWVTATGLDLVVKTGESRLIDPGRHGAVVTALDRHKVVFETWAA